MNFHDLLMFAVEKVLSGSSCYLTGLKINHRHLFVGSLVIFKFLAMTADAAELPPLNSEDYAIAPLATAPTLQIDRFEFSGNTVFSDEELSELLADYVGRPITSEELLEARELLTQHYVSNGYVNSGAVIKRQTMENGVLTFDIVEGQLTEISLKSKTRRRLRDGFVEGNVRQGLTTPLNMNQLRDRLQVLRQNINIGRVNAELKPTGIPGESLLEINLEESNPYAVEFIFDNHRAPSIGAERLYLAAAHNNLTGNSDSLGVLYGLTRNGFEDMKFGDDQDIAGYYILPVNHLGTTFELSASKNDTLIVEEPFDQFDIISESTTFGFALRHPLYRKFDREVSLSLSGERRNNETFFDGEPFSFSLGSQDGETTVSVLRFGINGLKRSQSGVIAAYSAVSVGLDVLDSTQNSGSVPDSSFVSWQGQLQYIRRLFDTDIQLVSKMSAQLSVDPLLSLEQFSLGGSSSVRGYRENQIIRDNGVAGSLELRIPLITDKAGRFLLRLAPFVDYGYGWNKRDGEENVPESEDLWSAGVGLLFDPHPRVTGQIYWGHAFQDFETSDYDLQDDGIHFSFTVNVF